MEVFGAENVAQGRLGQEARRMVSIFHIGNRHGGVWHTVVDHCIHRYCYTVFGQNLQFSNQLVNELTRSLETIYKKPWLEL